MGDTEEPRCHPEGFTGQRSRDPEEPQFPCLEGGHPARGCRMEFSSPEDKRAQRPAGELTGGVGVVGRPRPELVDVLSPPPNILGFWAEVSWLIWVPISGRLSCH